MRVAVDPDIGIMLLDEGIHVDVERREEPPARLVAVELPGGAGAVVRQYHLVTGGGLLKGAREPRPADAVKLRIVVGPKPVVVVDDLMAVVHPRLDTDIEARIGDSPERRCEDLDVADDHRPVIQVPDVVADLMFVVDEGPVNGNAVLMALAGHGVAIVFVVSRNDDGLLKISRTPVEERIRFDAPTLQVADVTAEQQDVATFGKSVGLQKPAVHSEFQV